MVCGIHDKDNLDAWYDCYECCNQYHNDLEKMHKTISFWSWQTDQHPKEILNQTGIIIGKRGGIKIDNPIHKRDQ